MTDLLQQIESVAAADVSILLTGENGTGKSQLAQFIHQYSSRSLEPFISVNMGAISESLFESEMFGHKKGAFTDAKTDRIGRFELAQKGTMFLDEIANIPLSQQAKLLRILESGEFEALGSSETLHTDVRIISATNGDVNAMIVKDEVREDLLYRLNTIEFRLPPLRERQQDIIPLAEYFLEKFRLKYHRDVHDISAEAKQALLAYHWPGNIRELSHLTERAVLLAKYSELVLPDFNLKSQDTGTSIDMRTLEQAERLLLKQALTNTDGNMTHAAKLLGLTKSSMYRRLEKYEDLQK
jgi:transcriptional regulator with PAS, ATPase and Fis domain